MLLKDHKLDDFTAVLASSSPAPGGGSAAGLEGALGAALTAMVANLTDGRKAYAEHWDHAREVAAQAQALREKLVDVMDRDTEAYLAVTAAYALPKETDEQKADRSAAIQKAMAGCTATPFETMELCAQALELTASLMGRSNKNAASDLGVAALSLSAAMRGAWLNVCINLGSLKDRALADSYRARGQALMEKALPLADEIYQAVLASL